jgi:hypothetical protein
VPRGFGRQGRDAPEPENTKLRISKIRIVRGICFPVSFLKPVQRGFDSLACRAQISVQKTTSLPSPFLSLRPVCGSVFLLGLADAFFFRSQLDGFILRWEKKSSDEWRGVLDELVRPKVGRRARITGKVEKVA